MSYTTEDTKNALGKEWVNINNLYKAKCINWKGKTNDTKVLYSELIAQELIQNLELFKSIEKITRTNTYCRKEHAKISIDLESNRKEEIFAKRLAYLKLEELGEIKDYQIPLKNASSDKGLGKIDLISYREDMRSLFLIELKYIGNEETLLRAMLEIYTYSIVIDKNKLVNDCLGDKNTDGIKLIPTVLLVEGCNAYKELDQMESGIRPKLKALALVLGIKFFTIELQVYETQL